MEVAMQTAIIGLGNIGATIAARLTAGGIDVIVSERNLDKAQQLGTKLGPRAKVRPVSEAVKAAEIVVLAIWFDAIKELLAADRSAFSGKIVVDPSNPIAPDGKGGFKKTIAEDQSSGVIIAGLLPGDAELVKAFGTLGAQSLANGANRAPEPAVLFYATDYPEAGRAVEKLIVASGFSPFDVGGIDQSIRIEVGGDLHEFGKLGKLVSATEAEQLLGGQVRRAGGKR
jgi:8-hydroxy-5-deazaflavin:NADPH oxidoreductase